MPRSFADRLDRTSLSRGSAGKGSLGRYSVGTDVSSVATRHWVNSVSDIYGPDEIEELLDDLNRLELATYVAEDFQDFDIDGSQIGSVPLDRPPVREEVASPTWSVRSWDSHTHYQQFKEPDGDDLTDMYPSRPMQSIVCYCDIATFKTPRTLLRVLLVVTSLACLSTVLTAGTAKTGLFAIPHFPRLRIIMFVTIFTILFTAFVLFLNISHLHALLPVDYGKLQTSIYLLLTVAYVVASSLVFHLQSESRYLDPPMASWTKDQLLIASILGFACSFETFLCTFNCGRSPSYDKMPESSTHFTLHETSSRAVTNDSLRPSAPNEVRPRTKQTQQYLVNENYIQEHTNVKHNHNPRHNSSNKVKSSSAKPSSSGGTRQNNHDTNNHNSSQNNQQIKNSNSSAVKTNSSAAATTSAKPEATEFRNTGAIPKKKRTNHMDEIVALPLDDLSLPQSSNNRDRNY